MLSSLFVVSMGNGRRFRQAMSPATVASSEMFAGIDETILSGKSGPNITL
jgi:hypothetical protein